MKGVPSDQIHRRVAADGLQSCSDCGAHIGQIGENCQLVAITALGIHELCRIRPPELLQDGNMRAGATIPRAPNITSPCPSYVQKIVAALGNWEPFFVP